jgi:hypothetical protein
MAENNLDLKPFFKQPSAVAVVRGASDLFGLLTRTLELPPGWAALVVRQAGDLVLVRPGGEVTGDGVSEVLMYRTGPLDLELAFEGIASSDGYQCDARVRVQVALVSEPADLTAFRKTVMGSRDLADLDGVQRYVTPVLREGLTVAGAARSAAVLVDGSDAEALLEAVVKKLEPAMFAAGLARQGAMRIAFTSPGYEAVRKTEADQARQRAQHAAREQLRDAVRTAQAEHVTHLESQLAELQRLADRSPELSMSDLIRTFSERERGELYQAMWQASPDQCVRWVVAASGDEVLFFTPNAWERPARRMTPDGGIGALRSVTAAVDEAGRDILIVGAALGVHVIEPEAETPRATYKFNLPDGQSVRTGVNAAAVGGGRVFATHSQMGLVVWPQDQPNQLVRLLNELTAASRTVRFATVAQGRLWLAADHQVIHVPLDAVWDAGAVHLGGSTSRITALAVRSDAVYAGNEEGQILRWALDTDEPPQAEVLRSSTGRAVESVDVVTAGGVQRILYADESTALNVQVVGDSYICRYDGKGQPLRRAAVAGDWLVAMNDNRDRLFYWRPHVPDAPAAVVNVGRLTGRSIQDLCIVTGAANDATRVS